MMGAIVPFRPAALPTHGARVDVHDFGASAHVILFVDRIVADQRHFPTMADADAHARTVADAHGCPVIHHNYRSGDAA